MCSSTPRPRRLCSPAGSTPTPADAEAPGGSRQTLAEITAAEAELRADWAAAGSAVRRDRRRRQRAVRQRLVSDVGQLTPAGSPGSASPTSSATALRWQRSTIADPTPARADRRRSADPDLALRSWRGCSRRSATTPASFAPALTERPRPRAAADPGARRQRRARRPPGQPSRRLARARRPELTRLRPTAAGITQALCSATDRDELRLRLPPAAAPARGARPQPRHARRRRRSRAGRPGVGCDRGGPGDRPQRGGRVRELCRLTRHRRWASAGPASSTTSATSTSSSWPSRSTAPTRSPRCGRRPRSRRR